MTACRLSGLQPADVPLPHDEKRGFWISDEEFPVFLHAVAAGICAELGLPTPGPPRPELTVLRGGRELEAGG